MRVLKPDWLGFLKVTTGCKEEDGERGVFQKPRFNFSQISDIAIR